MKLVSIYFSAVFLVHYVLVSTEISVLMSFQVLTNLILRAQLFGRVILLPLPNVYVNVKDSKSKCTSDRERTRNVAFRSLLPELGLQAFIFTFLK